MSLEIIDDGQQAESATPATPDRRAFLMTLGGFAALALAGCAPQDRTGEVDPGPEQPAAPAPGGVAQEPAGADDGDSLLSAIEQRRSIRAFTDDPIPDADILQMLWAAQGITLEDAGFRAAPSAGALYPLETYVATAEGVRRYNPRLHELEDAGDSDIRGPLAVASLGQMFIAQAPAVFVINAVYSRTEARYGDRGRRYVHMEVGHAAQNLSLMAVHQGRGSVMIGAFIDADVKRLLGSPAEEDPLYIIPVGTPG